MSTPASRRYVHRLWLAVKLGRNVFWLFPFTGETGRDRDKWTGFGFLAGTRDPR